MRPWLLLTTLLTLIGCSEGPAESAPTNQKQADQSSGQQQSSSRETESPYRRALETGGIAFQTVAAEGAAPTQSAALVAALDNAIAQVNGRRIVSRIGTERSSINLDLAGIEYLELRSDAVIQQVVSSSQGAVRNFSVTSVEPVTMLEAEQTFRGSIRGGWFAGPSADAEAHERLEVRHWRVKIEADVAKWAGATEDSRPKLAISQARVRHPRYEVGDTTIEAQKLSTALRSRLAETVGRTNRFVMLDRALQAEIGEEMAFIQGGNVRPEEIARMGQQYAADLILIPEIERFEYRRHVATMRRSDRELISYSGSADILLRLVNPATGEVLLANRFSKRFPELEPSSLPRTVDGRSITYSALDELASNVAREVVHSVYPIAVIATMGSTLVLNFGQGSVEEGQRYEIFELGDELTDPQTGLDMGRLESSTGFARIARVMTDTAYATWEGDAPDVSNFRPGQYEVRPLSQEAVAAQAPSLPSAPRQSEQTNEPSTPPSNEARAPAGPQVSQPPPPENDPDW